MNERVRKLRDQSMNAIPRLNVERALLVTDSLKNMGFVSAPMKRALTFKTLMERKEICINDGELIVGERGPAARATSTFPELCCHSMQDLDILNTREKVWFRVDDQTKAVYKDELIPFWKGKTLREKIFSEMTHVWKDCYDAGIFTEFMEQRGDQYSC